MTGANCTDQRYYAVGMGRFNSADPMKGDKASDPGSWNKYVCVLGDPVNFTDRRGLMLDSTISAEDCFNDMELCLEPPYGGGAGAGPPQGGSPAEPQRIPCEINASTIDNYIASTPIYGDPTLKKPLEGLGQAFIDAALAYNTNPAVLVAIGFQESHWGYDQRDKKTNNAFGLLHADGSKLTFDNWSDGISAASKTVDSAYNRGNRSVSDLYSGLPGAYCTHNGCSDAISSMEKKVRQLGEDPNYLGFDCEMKDGVLVKKQ